MKIFFKICAVTAAAALLAGCSCISGYHAPPYKLTTIGCTAAWVPTR